MSDGEKQQIVASDTEEPYGAMSDDEYEEQQQALAPQPQPQPQHQQQQQQQQAPRTMQRARQQRQVNNPLPQANNVYNQQMMAPSQDRITGNMGGRTGAIRESRIKDRPQPQEVRDSSLKIKIELDLEVEVDLYARVKGDVTIGLM